MQIALLHYSVPPVIGGVESVLAQQARLMADAGHNVRGIAGRGEKFDPNQTRAPTQHRADQVPDRSRESGSWAGPQPGAG